MAAKFSRDPREVADHWPLAQVFAFHAWASENNGLVEVERKGDGYIAQEIKKRMEQS